MIRSLITILCLLLSVLAMVYYGEAVKRLSTQISEPTPDRTVQMEIVGETSLGVTIYQAENGNCYDENIDQVSCPN